jgi:hypothetical protein
MNSAKLRPIVEAMTPDILDLVVNDLRFDAHRSDVITAIVTLANHAGALVELVAACEESILEPWRGLDKIERALAAVTSIGADHE